MQQVTLIDILFRILAAMSVGIVIGGQRTRTSHPAGLRTHTLVALGACVVMLTGCLLYQDTNAIYGTGPDPARLGAQVISGIGFLGAGTILRDGISVRGLTTAASLWAVACLGLAAGVGYFQLAFVGCGALFVTLSFFESLQAKVRRSGQNKMKMLLECDNMSEVLIQLDTLANRYFAALSNLSFSRTAHNTYVVSFLTTFPAKDWEFAQSEFTRMLAAVPGIIRMEHPDSNS